MHIDIKPFRRATLSLSLSLSLAISSDWYLWPIISVGKIFKIIDNLFHRPFTCTWYFQIATHRLSRDSFTFATHQAQSTVTIILAHFFNPLASPTLQSRIARISQISDRTRAVKYSQNSRRLNGRACKHFAKFIFARIDERDDDGDGDNSNGAQFTCSQGTSELFAGDWRRNDSDGLRVIDFSCPVG